MVDIASLSIQVDATSVKQADVALDGLGNAALGAEKSTKRFERSADSATKKTGNFRNVAGQLGFQIQDVAVQLQSGTSAFTVLGQQGSQVASIFGPGGAVIGAFIAVTSAIAGSLIPALFDAQDEMEGLEDRVDSLIGKLNVVQLREFNTAIEQQKARIVELRDAYNQASNQQVKQLSVFEKLISTQEEIRQAEREAIEQNVKASSEAFQVLSDAELKLQRLLDERNSLLDEIDGEGEKRKERELSRRREIRNALSEELEAQRLFASTIEQLDPAFAQQERFFDQLDAIDSFNIAAQEKERLREEAFRQHQERMASIAGKGTSSVIAANEVGFRGLTETQAAGLGATAQALGNFASIAEAGGQKSFNTYKRLAQAQAAISSTLAVLAVLGDATIQPTPLRLGLAFSIGALAVAQVAQIQKQKFDGQRAFGGQVQAGRSFLVGEKGPELLTMGSQNGFITPNHRMPGQGGGDSAITIVNNTSAPIGNVTEQRISATERAIIIEEARSAVSRDVANPNSQLSRSLSRNTTARRSR